MSGAFAMALERFGPGGTAHLSAEQARRYCSRLARRHYENFTVASILLPRRLLRHFHNVYAYCRWADDLADETAGDAEALGLLRWWRTELRACYEGEPNHPVMVALRETIHRFSIPPEPFLRLLQAFEQDQVVKRYETYEQLLGYCKNSANPVGELVLYLCECHDATRVTLSDAICTALQLTNFWQDVARDWSIGRVYLPAEDRRAFGYSDSDLEARRFTPAFAQLLAYEVARARTLFQRGLPLLGVVPAEVRIDIELFVRGGLAVLRKIERQGYNVWDRRPALTGMEKALLLGGAVSRRLYAAACV